MERQGVPAVAIVTDVFHATGEAMATSWGVPGYRFLETAHPIATLGDKDLDARADALTEQIVALIGTTT